MTKSDLLWMRIGTIAWAVFCGIAMHGNIAAAVALSITGTSVFVMLGRSRGEP